MLPVALLKANLVTTNALAGASLTTEIAAARAPNILALRVTTNLFGEPVTSSGRGKYQRVDIYLPSWMSPSQSDGPSKAPERRAGVELYVCFLKMHVGGSKPKNHMCKTVEGELRFENSI